MSPNSIDERIRFYLQICPNCVAQFPHIAQYPQSSTVPHPFGWNSASAFVWRWAGGSSKRPTTSSASFHGCATLTYLRVLRHECITHPGRMGQTPIRKRNGPSWHRCPSVKGSGLIYKYATISPRGPHAALNTRETRVPYAKRSASSGDRAVVTHDARARTAIGPGRWPKSFSGGRWPHPSATAETLVDRALPGAAGPGRTLCLRTWPPPC